MNRRLHLNPPARPGCVSPTALLCHGKARHRVTIGLVPGGAAVVSNAQPGSPASGFGSVRLHRRSAIPLTMTLAQRSPFLVLPTVNGHRQARAGPWPEGAAAANPATRMNAVAPTATAPTIENMICQVSDGMACFTTPCVP